MANNFATNLKIADWLGTRTGYTVLILFWSITTGLHGLVGTVFGMGIARFLLGLGEGGGFPCSAQAISEWFPPEERAFAFGILNTGSSVGAVIAPPLIALIILTLNWRWIFLLTGAAGTLWALVWGLFYNPPEKERLIAPEELDHIQKSLARTDPAATKVRISWIDLFKYRQIWGLLLAKFLTDAVWFFFIFWLPKYLGDVGLVLTHFHSYALVLISAALFHPIAFLLILLLIPRIEPVPALAQTTAG